MSEEEYEPDEQVDLETIDEELAGQYQLVMEMNADLQKKAAFQARKMLKAAERYDAMAERCRAIATLSYVSAQQLAQQAGDILAAEAGFEVVTEQDTEGDAEDDSEEYDDGE